MKEIKKPVYGFRVWEAEIIHDQTLLQNQINVLGKVDPSLKTLDCVSIDEIILPPLYIPEKSQSWQKNNTAVCKARQGHVAPNSNCSCGLYAYFSFTRALKEIYSGAFVCNQILHNKSSLDRTKIFFIGLIAGYGKTELHRDGFRAEKADIVALAPYKEIPSNLMKKVQASFAEKEITVVDLKSFLNQAFLQTRQEQQALERDLKIKETTFKQRRSLFYKRITEKTANVFGGLFHRLLTFLFVAWLFFMPLAVAVAIFGFLSFTFLSVAVLGLVLLMSFVFEIFNFYKMNTWRLFLLKIKATNFLKRKT